jgi:fructosamine-3-kinase
MSAKITKLLDHLDSFLPEPEKPSLLHGDLWNGNVMCGPDGKAWLIDPAVYVGSREADLEMMQLFGGFPAEFYNAYYDAYPQEKGYEDRRDLYNLYQLLNHLNLFGGTYLEPVCSIIDEYVK